MKHLVIVNAFAGHYTKEFEEHIQDSFKGLDLEIFKSTGPRSSTAYLKQYFKKNTEETVRVYACGGDGTVNEVLNGLVGAKNAELAILAIGTGNDFVKVYGGETKFQSFETLIKGETKEADLSKITAETLDEPMYSINVVNFGFDAIVGAKGNYYKEHGYPEKAKKKGMNPYDYALKNDAMKYGRFNDIEVVADGEKLNEKQLLLCTLAHGKYVGGKFLCAPKSVNDDGLIDICVLKTMTFLGLGMIIGPYTAGKHLNKPNKKIVYRRATKVEMYGPQEFDVCVDGEMIKGKHFVVECLPKAIKVVVPKE